MLLVNFYLKRVLNEKPQGLKGHCTFLFLKYISPQIVKVVLNPTIKVSLYSGLLHHPFLSFFFFLKIWTNFMGHRWTFLEKACSGVSCYRCDWKCRSGPDLCESGLDLDITFTAIPAPPYRRALFTQITPSAIQTGENETEKYLAKKISLQRVHTRKMVEHQNQSKMSFFKLISRDN